MAEEGILDLNILRPKRQCVRLSGKIIDVSMIPCGITFEIDQIVRELMQMNQEEIGKGNTPETKKALDLTIKLCSTFACVKNPEMTEEWFRAEADPGQVSRMAEIIKDALVRSYSGVKAYGKN